MTPVNEEGVVPILRKAKADGTPVVLEGNAGFKACKRYDNSICNM